MRAAAAATLIAVLAAPSLRAEVDVQYKDGQVSVRASAAPLSEVLDRLARATGMKVVQQGATPSMLLSLSLENRTPAEAVFGVFEGLGLNYAFVLDATGSKIETLILAGASGAKAAPASTSPGPVPPSAPRYFPRREAPLPAAGPDEPAEPEEEEAPADEGEEAAEEGEEAVPEEKTVPPGPRGNVLQPPSEPVFPSSPFAPRAPIFTPQPEPQPQPTPTPPPRPR
jgi:hypothetical protein